MCADLLAALARAQEEQNNVEWIPKLNAHAQNVCSALLLPSQNLKSVLVSIRHGFAPLETSRGRQEDQHTQFARRMETKVVVATNVAISWDCSTAATHTCSVSIAMESEPGM